MKKATPYEIWKLATDEAKLKAAQDALDELLTVKIYEETNSLVRLARDAIRKERSLLAEKIDDIERAQ